MKPTDRVQLGITHGGKTFVRLLFDDGDSLAIDALAPFEQVAFIKRVIAEAVAEERERCAAIRDYLANPELKE